MRGVLNGVGNAVLSGVTNLEVSDVVLRPFNSHPVAMKRIKFNTIVFSPSTGEPFFDISGPAEVNCIVSPETVERLMLHPKLSSLRLFFANIVLGEREEMISHLLFVID